MTSPAQTADRENATPAGPVTEAEIAAARRNVGRDPLLASHVVLAHEDLLDFEVVMRRYLLDFQPGDTHERFLVELMAQARWRLARFRRLETAALDSLLGAADPSAPDTRLAQSLTGKEGDPMAKIERYAAAAERSYHKACRELSEAKKARFQAETEQSQFRGLPQEPEPEPAPEPVSETKPIPPQPGRTLVQGPDEDFMDFLDRVTAPPCRYIHGQPPSASPGGRQ